MKATNKKVLLDVISLEVLVKEFVKNNNFSQPKSIINISKGKLILWDDNSQVILYGKISDVGLKQNHYDNGPEKYFRKSIKYFLKGVLEGNSVKLETEISNTNYYSKDALRKIELCQNRKDDLDYWFVMSPKKARNPNCMDLTLDYNEIKK